MATIQSSGLVKRCNHKNATVTMNSASDIYDDNATFQFTGFHCPDCERHFEIIDRRGQPVPHADINCLEKSKAIESVRASVPAKKPAPDPSLARSNIKRDGIPQGSVAPEFTLPTLDGSAEVALAEYRGRRVMVVFMRADCPPCDLVAPHLQQLHESGFPVLAIANRNGTGKQAQEATDAMRSKAAKLGLTFPVLMQSQHKVARDYASFFTPVAYVVAEDGTLESGILISDAITRKVGELLTSETPHQP